LTAAALPSSTLSAAAPWALLERYQINTKIADQLRNWRWRRRRLLPHRSTCTHQQRQWIAGRRRRLTRHPISHNECRLQLIQTRRLEIRIQCLQIFSVDVDPRQPIVGYVLLLTVQRKVRSPTERRRWRNVRIQRRSQLTWRHPRLNPHVHLRLLIRIQHTIPILVVAEQQHRRHTAHQQQLLDRLQLRIRRLVRRLKLLVIVRELRTHRSRIFVRIQPIKDRVSGVFRHTWQTHQQSLSQVDSRCITKTARKLSTAS